MVDIINVQYYENVALWVSHLRFSWSVQPRQSSIKKINYQPKIIIRFQDITIVQLSITAMLLHSTTVIQRLFARYLEEAFHANAGMDI